MNLRKIIRENIEQMVNNRLNDSELIKLDGFEFINKKTDENKNLIWKYSKSLKDKSNIKKDGDYIFNVFIAKTPNENWYYKIFVYWKSHTSNVTSGKGKDFELQFGPFNNAKDLQKDLDYNLNHNILFAFTNYKDDNKSQLNDEIFIMIEKVKEKYNDLISCEDSYFDDLKKEIKNLLKNKSEVQEYIDKNYPDEDDKQQLLLMLGRISSLNNLKEIENIKSIF